MSCNLSSTLSEDVLVRSPEVARAEAARVKRTRREWNPAIISCSVQSEQQFYSTPTPVPGK